ncbi:MAG TPA: sugar phosphate isomerase/epimerase family protein [Kofleriaceae bacterium]|nr:sugar phosphate isomerase/epimerase family protein [Kofleriaceae bacterium]
MNRENTIEESVSARIPFVTSVAAQQSLPIDEAIAFAVTHRCTRFYIEGAYHADRSDTWSPQRIEHYRAVIRNHGLRPIFHGNYKLPLAHEDEEVRQAAVRSVMREVDIAAALGAAVIVHGSCIFTHRKPMQARLEAIDAFARSVQALYCHAEPLGVELWLENLENYKDRHPFHTIYSQRSEYEYVLSHVPGAKFILDVGHENVGSGDPVGVFTALADRIVALDVNDNRGDYDTHYGLGKGTVDFPRLIQAVVQRGWSGHITVETRGSSLASDLEHLAVAYESCVASAQRSDGRASVDVESTD